MRRFLKGLTASSALVVALAACNAAGGSAAQPTVTTTVTVGQRSGETPAETAKPDPGKPHPTPKPTSKPTALGKRPVVAPDGRTCPDHPTPDCTGAPPGMRLTKAPLNDDGAAHRVDIAGRRLDRVHIAGDLVITADNVVITNSVIDGRILNEKDGDLKSFTITDSTVGPETGCDSLPAIGEGEFTAVRVNIRNHGDGIRDAGDNIVVMDTYINLCSNPGDHSDGIQGYTAGRNLVFDHNTIDQRDVPDHNAPFFFPVRQNPRVANLVMTNNLLMGGTFSIQIWDIQGYAIVRNNMLLDNSWDYKPVEAECDQIDWRDNKLVTIDERYRVTAETGPLECMG
ncbi:hypothetical protein OIE66_37900 [Nonomuraea sp. NBC_01738]|uniref:hypothetical protein n=1 Tax=Nonomuraea sp. NBC_01738 TaxID=2976003 RepID=UPI002E13D01C|nr:hypothetical protein OIE66_37900 [Nonomuraea sp. NBC_01738]